MVLSFLNFLCDLCPGHLEEWLSAICETSVVKPKPSTETIKNKPSLWRDAALSFYIHLIRSVKLHLYCTDIEDALDLRVRQANSQLEVGESDGNVNEACEIARRSALSGLVSRSVKYALLLGDSCTDTVSYIDWKCEVGVWLAVYVSVEKHVDVQLNESCPGV